MKKFYLLVLLLSCSPCATASNTPPFIYPDGSIGAVIKCDEMYECKQRASEICSLGYDVVKDDRPQRYALYWWMMVRCKEN